MPHPSVAAMALVLSTIAACGPHPRTPSTPRAPKTPIHELRSVTLGGVKQVVLLHGTDTANPLILFIHGGPGNSDIPLAYRYRKPLDNHATLVHWDQRGAGRSHDPAHPPKQMEIDRFVEDAKELAMWLHRRFPGRKLYVVGHSWGTVIGALLTHRHPELVAAYVGNGQVVHMKQAAQVTRLAAIKRAKARQDQTSLQGLMSAGPARVQSLKTLLPLMKIMTKLGGNLHQQRDYTQFSRWMAKSDHPLPRSAAGATMFSLRRLWKQVMRVNLFGQAPTFSRPVFFFCGRYDLQVPPSLVRTYIAKIAAPSKRLIWFDKSAHWPQLEQPLAFQRALLCQVLKRGCRQK